MVKQRVEFDPSWMQALGGAHFPGDSPLSYLGSCYGKYHLADYCNRFMSLMLSQVIMTLICDGRELHCERSNKFIDMTRIHGLMFSYCTHIIYYIY